MAYIEPKAKKAVEKEPRPPREKDIDYFSVGPRGNSIIHTVIAPNGQKQVVADGPKVFARMQLNGISVQEPKEGYEGKYPARVWFKGVNAETGNPCIVSMSITSANCRLAVAALMNAEADALAKDIQFQLEPRPDGKSGDSMVMRLYAVDEDGTASRLVHAKDSSKMEAAEIKKAIFEQVRPKIREAIEIRSSASLTDKVEEVVDDLDEILPEPPKPTPASGTKPRR